MNAPGVDSPTERSRRETAAIGMAVVAVASLAAAVAYGRVVVLDPRGVLFWIVLWSLAGGAASWLAGPIHGRPFRIVADALLTWLMALLLLPVLVVVVNLPGVLGGGPTPCIQWPPGSQCPSGLHGMDALVELAKTCLTWYVLDVLLLLMWWVPVVLLVPATIWDWLARR
ncbi:MAG: hypothetical protein ACK2U9_17855 [Anaerolineae bacterium]